MAEKVVSLTTTGMPELARRFAKLESDLKFKVAGASINAGAQVIKKYAISFAPQSVRPHVLGRGSKEIVQPGNLKRNIFVRKLKEPENGLTAEYVLSVRRGSGKAGKDAFYAGYVEFGTVKMPAHPFLSPAFQIGASDAVDAVRDQLAKLIAKAGE